MLHYNKLTPSRIIFLGFLDLILVGALLLMLPISSNLEVSFIDALFTSTSATCVTGLVSLDPGTTWTLFGQIVILMLIQIGGLGIMSIFTVFACLLGRHLNLKERLTVGESINEFNISDIIRIFFKILAITLFFEILGAILIFSQLQPIYGTFSAIWESLFLSVSGFCNAGFDTLGTVSSPFCSLTLFSGNSFLLVTIASLIILGGLGFVVWKDVWTNKFNFKKYSLHSKIVLISTTFLLVLGTVLFFAFENDNLLSEMTFIDKLSNSFFSSASPRTAGFASLNIAGLKDESKLLTMILMFIGAAPGSTAGGVKVTTITVLILAAIFFIRGRGDIQVMKNSISNSLIFKSICIFMLAILLVLLGTFVLLLDNSLPLSDILFEVISAFGTVGLSTGITPFLNPLSKFVLMIIMFFGRLGPLTAVIAFWRNQIIHDANYKYAEGKLSVG